MPDRGRRIAAPAGWHPHARESATTGSVRTTCSMPAMLATEPVMRARASSIRHDRTLSSMDIGKCRHERDREPDGCRCSSQGYRDTHGEQSQGERPGAHPDGLQDGDVVRPVESGQVTDEPDDAGRDEPEQHRQQAQRPRGDLQRSAKVVADLERRHAGETLGQRRRIARDDEGAREPPSVERHGLGHLQRDENRRRSAVVGYAARRYRRPGASDQPASVPSRSARRGSRRRRPHLRQPASCPRPSAARPCCPARSR